MLLVVLPPLVSLVFTRSERTTRRWIGEGMNVEMELLRLITSHEFSQSRPGAYLRRLTSRFPGEVVADMFCLLRLELELGLRVKGMLMAREAGLDMPPDPTLPRDLKELDYLRSSIGKTGLLALSPIRGRAHRNEWNEYLLAQTARSVSE